MQAHIQWIRASSPGKKKNKKLMALRRRMIIEPKMKVKHLLPQVRDKYIIQENFTRKLKP